MIEASCAGGQALKMRNTLTKPTPLTEPAMHFDLTDLHLFLNICEAGSITAGAKASHLALPSASARLRGMEASLGTALFERQRRGVSATPAGQALAHHARVLLQQVAHLQEDLGEYALGFKGRVRLLCNTATLSEFLPDPLGKFLKAHPNVDVDVSEQASYRIVPALLQGTADVGIVSDAVDLSGLDALAFRRDRLELITPADHPLASRRALRYADTLDYDFVALEAGSALSVHLDDQAARAGRQMRARVRMRSFSALARMVQRGVGVAIIPESASRRLRLGAGLRRLSLTDEWADRRLLVCVRALDSAPAYVQALVQALRA
ncbi:LysR substrate-binding domain protein [Bordetella holmesii 04P3421]|nr:bacterial regulatory helix-turn-helix, lysR family protein [Bordetella holmesii ATCC 51541]EWM40398.1 bacterial regulatory helix-turn-helix, lysR family protein [Bordetella holmesii 35009]KAK81366.1 LysR substrate-binding domain protein [Bordetella holmesii CDC-H809-BH]KAK88630.1 LysR substrate-binding domain protein [Bordetella holmesii H620]KCV00671.1 LysR substrate-binding domain protein [Bordetella holmesii CDC-H719-BH]KCV15004.1 LysR substrate-binding domain protein [Bordetella holmesi